MAQFYWQISGGFNNETGWLTTKNSYSFTSTDINNRLVMYDYSDGTGYVGAPGWQWGNQINDHVFDNWGGSAYWTDNSFFQKGVPVTYLPNGQICLRSDPTQRLCNFTDRWIYWSNDPKALYLTIKRVDVSSEEAQKLAESHPHVRAPVTQRPATNP